MKTWKVLLVAFEREHEWGKELREILAASDEPHFQLQFQTDEEQRVHLSAKRLSIQLGILDPALTFLTFDRVPQADLLGELLEAVGERSRGPPSIVVVPTQSPKEIMQIVHQGARDVWPPPLRAVEVLARVGLWLEQAPPKEDETAQKLKEKLRLDEFVGQSPALLTEIEKIPAVAVCNAHVLIRGETGTGKEICARAIHDLSPRSGGPFVAVNCGALPLDLVENELFGHETGAFTSANAAAGGLIEQANGGTLFLDEIDSLPLPAQVKLLRFLQDQQYRPLGSRKVRTADLRVLAATNADIDQLVSTGRFRRDLLYRLSVLDLTLPALRARGRDTELLAQYFLHQYATKFGKPARAFTSEAITSFNSIRGQGTFANWRMSWRALWRCPRSRSSVPTRSGWLRHNRAAMGRHSKP